MTNDELMRRFLIVLSQGKLGGGIKLHVDSIEGVDQNARVEFTRDGPLWVLDVVVPKDQWGRVIDRCGQVKCRKCETYINYDYPDGSKRALCAKHDG